MELEFRSRALVQISRLGRLKTRGGNCQSADLASPLPPQGLSRLLTRHDMAADIMHAEWMNEQMVQGREAEGRNGHGYDFYGMSPMGSGPNSLPLPCLCPCL